MFNSSLTNEAYPISQVLHSYCPVAEYMPVPQSVGITVPFPHLNPPGQSRQSAWRPAVVPESSEKKVYTVTSSVCLR